MSEEYIKKFHPELIEYYQEGDCCTWIVELRKQVSEKDKEIERLNNIINELHKALNKEINNLQNAKVESKEYVKCRTLCDILNKLSDLIGELKESGNNEN